MAARKVTLKDISQAAGVGVATVSRALADHPDVSVATRDRVREIAQNLGYRPSAAARALRGGGFRAISMVVPDNGWGWWEPVVHSASAAASEVGYQLLVHPISGVTGGVATVVTGLENVPTEGVVVVSIPDQRSVREVCDRIGIPGVAIDDSSPDLCFPTISAANRAGAADMTDHLIAMGRSRVAFVRPAIGGYDADWGEGLFLAEREQGYRDAISSSRGRAGEALVIEIDHRNASAARCPEVGRLFDLASPPDALFCAFDGLAAPVLRELSARNVAVPRDVAVAGFDDERAAILTGPQLTTMRQPYDAMGRAAVDLLLRAIEGNDLPIERRMYDTELVVRSSTTDR